MFRFTGDGKSYPQIQVTADYLGAMEQDPESEMLSGHKELTIWKVLVPLYLNGYNPVLAGMIITGILTVVILSLVYGFERRTAAAVSGAMAGPFVTAAAGAAFTGLFKIHGAIMPYSDPPHHFTQILHKLTSDFTSP